MAEKPAVIKRDPFNNILKDIEVKGMVSVFDKDGKLKAELPITSIEGLKEGRNNAT